MPERLLKDIPKPRNSIQILHPLDFKVGDEVYIDGVYTYKIIKPPPDVEDDGTLRALVSFSDGVPGYREWEDATVSFQDLSIFAVRR